MLPISLIRQAVSIVLSNNVYVLTFLLHNFFFVHKLPKHFSVSVISDLKEAASEAALDVLLHDIEINFMQYESPRNLVNDLKVLSWTSSLL
jgi:hypothetical protein